MQARAIWNGKMSFTGDCGGQSVAMDAKAPFGSGSGLTPKELLAIAVGGCTGMDVVALLKKFKQPFDSFEVVVNPVVREGVQPPVFEKIELIYNLKGRADQEKLIEAVRLSQTKFCAVSAMLWKSVPIHFRIFLNELEIGSGDSHF